MNASIQQIVLAYEEGHLGVSDIAEAFPSFDEVSIKAVLMSHSPVYRKAYRTENLKEDFDEDDNELFLQGMKNLFLTTEDENLKFRIAKFGRNDFKGRLDIAKNMTGLVTNVLEFNQQLMRARLSVNKSKGVITDKTPEPRANLAASESIQEAELVTEEKVA